ncbi:MAG: two-component regulator propeller domain-containing protein, partial [Lutibacter sp.]|nr:two-component regulator propeller domain-containing protein [Lutibacter sp.]
EKTINHITEFEGSLYLSTPFAIIVYDLENRVFGDTFFIGNQSSEIMINEVAILGEQLFAATEYGLYTADVYNPNLIDFNQWTLLFSGNFTAVKAFNKQLYTSKARQLFRVEESSLWLVADYAAAIQKIKTGQKYMTINTHNQVFCLDESMQEVFVYNSAASDPFHNHIQAAYCTDNKLFLGTQNVGLLISALPLQNPPDFKEVHPGGPSSNEAFSITATGNDDLWVVYGGYNSAYTPNLKKAGYDHFNGEYWVNTPYNDNLGVRGLSHVTVDPKNPDKAYISSWGDGMLVVENDEITGHWNHENSGLEKLIYTPAPDYVSIRINGAAFDTQGNLWIANAWVDKRIKKYSAMGQWSSFDMSTTITNGALGLNELSIDKNQTVWIGSRRNGVLIFNEQKGQKFSLTTAVDGGNLPDLNVRTVQADQSNRIWIGTKKGLVVYQNASDILSGEVSNAAPVIISEGGGYKKLLGEQVINSIATDGADNKWFGTETGGAIMTSPDGTNTLQVFNKDNSPLPSNTIVKISVAEESGKVYFATDKGIVAYQSDVTTYGTYLPAAYAYPNPATRTHDFITIEGRGGARLPKDCNVKILDTGGNLVFETNLREGQESHGGRVIWDKRNLAGKQVASGIYIVLLSANGTETSFVKIALIN